MDTFDSINATAEKRKSPRCSLCVNHMGSNAPRTLGHKNFCTYEKCTCHKCLTTKTRRNGTAKEQRQRRTLERTSENGQEMEIDEHYERAVEIYDEFKNPLMQIISKILMVRNGDKQGAKCEFLDVLKTVATTYDIPIENPIKNESPAQKVQQIVQNIQPQNIIYQQQPYPLNSSPFSETSYDSGVECSTLPVFTPVPDFLGVNQELPSVISEFNFINYD